MEMPTVAPTEASALLAALGDGETVNAKEEEIAAILAALLPREKKLPSPTQMRAASLRIAVGSFAGLLPVGAGLTAAHVLPAPVQEAFAGILNTTGLDVTPASATTSTGNGTLLADGAPNHSGVRRPDSGDFDAAPTPDDRVASGHANAHGSSSAPSDSPGTAPAFEPSPPSSHNGLNSGGG